MAEVIARSLGDGCLEGEHAPPALLIEDSFASRLCSHVFDHFVTNLAPQIALGKSHALLRFAGRCVESKPSSYFDLLKRKGVDASVVDKLVRILDCHFDPLGWKDCVPPLETARNSSIKENNAFVRDVLVGKTRIDLQSRLAWNCMDIVLKHIVLCNLYRLVVCCGTPCDHQLQAYAITFVPMVNMMHQANTYERILVFTHVSTMVASVQPIMQCTNQQTSPANLLWLEKNSHKAKFHVRLKCHNGKVQLLKSYTWIKLA